MVDYCFQQNILFGNCDTDNLLSDQESSCSSTSDLNSFLYLNFDEPITEEMISNVNFNSNSNHSTCSTSNQTPIYNTPYSTPLINGGSGVNFNQPIVQQNLSQSFNRHHSQNVNLESNQINSNTIVQNTINQDSQFALISNSNFTANPNLQQSNSANPLLSYSNHLQSNNQNTNELIRIQNECTMSPNSNTSTVSSSTHTLPSFMDTYSTNKLNNTTPDINNNSLIEDENVNSLTNSLTGTQLPTQQINRQQINNNLDENQFESDLFYDEFESPLNPQNDFDEQSYSNSSFTSVNLPTPPTTSSTTDLITMNNCQSNLFNLSTPVSTPLNGMLSNCSSPIQDSCNKPIKFKQEPTNLEFDCNNNLTVVNQQQQQQHQNIQMNNLIKPNQPSTSIYSPGANLFTSTNNKTINNMDQSNNLIYNNNNDFNTFDLDLYNKTDLQNDVLSSMNILNVQDQTRIDLNQTSNQQQLYNNGANRTQQQFNNNYSNSITKCTTTNSKKLNPLLNINQQQNKNYYNQANRLKLLKNQMANDTSANANKTKQQLNQYTQLNNAKYGPTNNGKANLVCLVCGDAANCCHYKVVTCEGCKGFFKRTVQKQAKYTCLGNKDCVVDKRRRNRCQYCRFKKCLLVGMVKSIVRTDNLKGRRGRLPSKAKFPMNTSNSKSYIEFIRPLLEKLIKIYPTILKSKQPIYRNENDFHELSSNNNSMEFNVQTSNFNSTATFNNELMGQFSRINNSNDKQQYLNQFKQIALQFTNDFARLIPGFNELNESDCKLLILNSSLEVFTLLFAYRHSSGSQIYEFDESMILNRQECLKLFGDWFNGAEELMIRLQNLEIDLPSLTYLLALVILCGYNDLNNSDNIEKIQNKFVNLLKELIDNEKKGKASYLPRLFSLLPDLKNLKEYLKSFTDEYQLNNNLLLQFY